MAEHIVTEGISGMHHYHLSSTAAPHVALCGAIAMPTSIPLDQWRVPFGEHLPKRPTWCTKCCADFPAVEDSGNG